MKSLRISKPEYDIDRKIWKVRIKYQKDYELEFNKWSEAETEYNKISKAIEKNEDISTRI